MCMARYCRELCSGPLYGTSYNDQCSCGPVPAKQKIDLIHPQPVTTLTSPPKVLAFLGEDVQDDEIAYDLGILMNFPCRVAHPVTVYPYTRNLIKVASPASELWLTESCGDMLEKHQLMVIPRTMDIVLRRRFEVYGVDLSAKPIFFRKKYGRRIRISSSGLH